MQKKAIHTKAETPFSKDVPTNPPATNEISIKKTSPILIEFQNKNAQFPDWRLQLQNAVKQRYSERRIGDQAIAEVEPIAAVANYPSEGISALEVQTDEYKIPEDIDNIHLKNALERIESSRKQFLKVEPEDAPKAEIKSVKKFNSQHNLRIANKDDKPVPISDELKTSVNFPSKPTLVPLVSDTKVNIYDTSELDPEFVPAKISSSFDRVSTSEKKKELGNDKIEIQETEAKVFEEIATKEAAETDTAEAAEVFDDYASYPLRFNAGLFDLIICSFSSLLLLSPFMLFGGSWFTAAGFFAFLATCAMVMFIYQTISVGVFGKTFGMHLFSLEMIDLNAEDYPTFQQAAVSSSIYFLSLVFLGLGFVTAFFDEERRTIHDIVSGTLVVKEI